MRREFIRSVSCNRLLPLLLLMVCTACGANVDSADVGHADPGAAVSAAPGCPAEAQAVVTSLYDWYIDAGDAYREDLQAQEPLFEPRFYADLQRAFALADQPQAKAVLDSDPFSGTQVGSFGYRVLGCQVVAGGVLEARVAVRSGLHPDRASDHHVVVLLKQSADGWLIHGIDFIPEQGQPERLHLQSQLDQLLNDHSTEAESSSSAQAGGDVLITPGFRVVVERHCPEGTVVCDQVSYLGQDRRSGASLRLTGSTMHSECADGVTPCRFLGYRFRNGNVTYEVGDDGLLRVTQAGKVLLEEQGTWQR